LAISFSAALIAILAILLLERQPRYNNRTLSQWLTNPGATEAQDAVCKIGTKAIPFALRWMGHEPSALRRFAIQLLNRLPNRPTLNPDGATEDFAGDGENVFYILGPKASSAIPELTRLAFESTEEGRTRRFIRCLGYIGPEAIPAVLMIMTNAQLNSRYCVIDLVALGSWGTNGAPFAPVLIQSLDDPDIQIFSAAARGLGNLPLPPSFVVPILAAKLESTNSWLRFGVADALGSIGPRARQATPQLQRLLQSSDKMRVAAAQNALQRIAPELLTNSPAQ
jgi:HEAT repeat protein